MLRRGLRHGTALGGRRVTLYCCSVRRLSGLFPSQGLGISHALTCSTRRVFFPHAVRWCCCARLSRRAPFEAVSFLRCLPPFTPRAQERGELALRDLKHAAASKITRRAKRSAELVECRRQAPATLPFAARSFQSLFMCRGCALPSHALPLGLARDGRGVQRQRVVASARAAGATAHTVPRRRAPRPHLERPPVRREPDPYAQVHFRTKNVLSL